MTKNLATFKKKNIINAIFLPMDKYYDNSKLKNFTNLKLIASPTTGDIHIDKSYIKQKKIKFINLKKNDHIMKNITATSDLVIAFIFELTRKILVSSSKLINGKGNLKSKIIVNNSLKFLSVGIIGLGRIGRHVAERCAFLGMKVFYYDPYVSSKKFKRVKNLDLLFKKCNIITLHLHYHKKLENMINIKLLKQQKKPSFFINTSRGELVKENDLIKSLKKNYTEACALDVIKNNFKFENNNHSVVLKFLKNKHQDNIIVTPKNSWNNFRGKNEN